MLCTATASARGDALQACVMLNSVKMRWTLLATAILFASVTVAAAVHTHACPEHEDQCMICQSRSFALEPAPGPDTADVAIVAVRKPASPADPVRAELYRVPASPRAPPLDSPLN